MNTFDINWLAVLVAAVASFGVGGVWYSPVLFARPWMRAAGKTDDDVRGERSAAPFVTAFAASAIAAVVVSIVADWAGADTIAEGALLGLMLGVGLVATAHATSYAFEGRSNTLLLINAGHDVARAIVIGLIVGAWQ